MSYTSSSQEIKEGKEIVKYLKKMRGERKDKKKAKREEIIVSVFKKHRKKILEMINDINHDSNDIKHVSNYMNQILEELNVKPNDYHLRNCYIFYSNFEPETNKSLYRKNVERLKSLRYDLLFSDEMSNGEYILRDENLTYKEFELPVFHDKQTKFNEEYWRFFFTILLMSEHIDVDSVFEIEDKVSSCQDEEEKITI